MLDYSAQIMTWFADPDARPIRPKELVHELHIGKKDLARFKAAVEELIAEGKLSKGKNKLLRTGAAQNQLLGTLKRTSKGFGYFRPHDPTLLGPDESLYIAPEDLRDAFSGDEVLVQMLKRRVRGQRCGRIVEVVHRSTSAFVGTYFEKHGRGFVAIDGTQFEGPISVGDPGAKGVQPDDRVVVEMLHFPSRTHAGEAVITKVLGARGVPGVDLLTILHEFQLPDEFPEAVLEEARLQAHQFDEGDMRGRLDLTGETIITIDPSDARDFDDAISLAREEDGNWRLGVHIADVAHFVRPGTILDREAAHRGTSVYLPDKVLPMLPEVISNALASLQQGKVRYTKSAFITFSPEGTPLHAEFANSAIKVTRRFAYEQVMPLLQRETSSFNREPLAFANDGALPQDNGVAKGSPLNEGQGIGSVEPQVLDLLHRMHTLAMILRRRRFEKGALDLAMPEVKIDMDRDGRVIGAHRVVHDESHQIIEEFMLAANIAVATKLTDSSLNFLRRTHATPDERKLRALSEFVKSLGYKIRPIPGRADLQKVLKEVQGTPHEYPISYAILRSMKRAAYSPDAEVGHFALNEEDYCHFTSPIRRYPDLTVHRLLDEVMSGEGGGRRAERNKRMSENTVPAPPADLVRLGDWCSFTERRADDAERELVKLKMLEYLADRIGEEMDATITGVEKFGFFCVGNDLPAEGLVHISSLPDDHYDYDDRSHTLVGRGSGRVFRLGSPVRVVVAQVDLMKRSLDLRLVEQKRKAPRHEPARPAKGRGRRG